MMLPDSQQQLGQMRACFVCDHATVPRPWTPGWIPYPMGWLCPRCSLIERVI